MSPRPGEDIHSFLQSQRPLYSKLHALVEDGDIAGVQEHLSQTREVVDPPGSASVAPIHVACFRGNIECVRLLMDADLSCLDTYTRCKSGDPAHGWRAMEFAQAGGHGELVSIVEQYRDDDDSDSDSDSDS